MTPAASPSGVDAKDSPALRSTTVAGRTIVPTVDGPRPPAIPTTITCSGSTSSMSRSVAAPARSSPIPDRTATTSRLPIRPRWYGSCPTRVRDARSSREARARSASAPPSPPVALVLPLELRPLDAADRTGHHARMLLRPVLRRYARTDPILAPVRIARPDHPKARPWT